MTCQELKKDMDQRIEALKAAIKSGEIVSYESDDVISKELADWASGKTPVIKTAVRNVVVTRWD